MTAPDILTTARLTLRPPAPRDWDGFRDWAMSDRARYAGGKQDLGGAWKAFAAELGHWQIHGFGMWAVTLTGDDTCIGFVGAWYPAHWPEREIGWLIWGAYEGQGHGFEAARAAIDHAFGPLGWDTAVSYIDPANTRSIALAERLGAVLDDAAQRLDAAVLVYRHPNPAQAPA